MVRPAQGQGGWTVYGGDHANTRYSPLKQVNTDNVQNLKVAWVLQLGSLEAQESTPILVGDTLFVTTSSGPRFVFAVNAKDGAIRWKYAPEIPGDIQATTCCGLDNRGAAYADGKVFVARLDGYLVALDAKTGKELWKTQVVDYKRAPRLRRRRRSSRIWSSPVLPEANMVSVALSAHSTRVPESWYGEPIRFRAKASPVAKPGKGIPGSTAAEPLGMSALLIRN